MGRPGEVTAVRRRRHLRLADHRVREACRDATSTDELIDALRAPFTDALGLSGLLLGATDPDSTALATATVVEHLPEAMATPWMHNEYLDQDVNKFSVLHRTGAPATTLHRATSGRPGRSPRHRRLHLAHGLGPELRTTFSRGRACWGVANLVREATDDDFSDDELAWLDALRPVITAGLQRTIALPASHAPAGSATGVIMLSAQGTVRSMTGAARELLADLWLCPFDGDGVTDALPGEAAMIATMVRARGRDGRRRPPARTRLRGRSGKWLTIQGDSLLTDDGETTGIVLVIKPSRPSEILPVVVAAHGLSPREREVLDQVLVGLTAAEIAGRLFISEHTARDHIRSILAKTGAGSRGELAGLLFQHRPVAEPV